jgi:hypothetical protein
MVADPVPSIGIQEGVEISGHLVDAAYVLLSSVLVRNPESRVSLSCIANQCRRPAPASEAARKEGRRDRFPSDPGFPTSIPRSTPCPASLAPAQVPNLTVIW